MNKRVTYILTFALVSVLFYALWYYVLKDLDSDGTGVSDGTGGLSCKCKGGTKQAGDQLICKHDDGKYKRSADTCSKYNTKESCLNSTTWSGTRNYCEWS